MLDAAVKRPTVCEPNVLRRAIKKTGQLLVIASIGADQLALVEHWNLGIIPAPA
jgi:hypothetical protein